MLMAIEVNGKRYLNQTESAKLLGVTGPTFRKKVREWGITPMEADVGRAVYYAEDELKKHVGLRPAKQTEA